MYPRLAVTSAVVSGWAFCLLYVTTLLGLSECHPQNRTPDRLFLQLLSTELDALDEFQFFVFLKIPFLNLGVY